MSAFAKFQSDPLIAVLRRALLLPALLGMLTLIGTLGFRYFSGGSWLDCLYMAVTTLTTVGYGEIVPMTPGGRAFVIAFLFVAFGVVSYSAFQIGQWIFSAEIQRLLELRHMQNRIEQLEKHYIVCGMGRMGGTICQHLHARQKPFVVIDSDEEKLRARCSGADWLFVVGDATDDQVLARAGIARARALATVLPTDADNVYVVLSARLLSSTLEIIARASGDSAAVKIERAGANRVVSPYSTGAEKIARFMLNPSIEDFLEIADGHGQDLELADVQITADSPYAGKRLHETDLRELGVIVVGIRRPNGERLMPPPGNAVIQPGDSLFAFGSASAVNRMIGETSNEA
ncbi:MAG TPA: potassium channel protein [Planctomycetaceae bacterium]|jgi:voltage-gated potassium channel|nr:potassium channel protein [Planctomycetaceae bacterium]